MSKFFIPDFESPARKQNTPGKFVSCYEPDTNDRFQATAKADTPCKSVRGFRPEAKPLVIYRSAFARCDIANGSVSDKEIRAGYSLRLSNKPFWYLDSDYIKHIRAQRDLNAPADSRNSDILLKDTHYVSSLSYKHREPLELFQHRSLVAKVFSDNDRQQQEGREFVDRMNALATSNEASWLWHLIFSLQSDDAFAFSVVAVSQVRSSLEDIYSKHATYSCFMADASIAFNEQVLQCPFIFAADLKLGREVYKHICNTAEPVFLECKSTNTRASISSIPKIPEIFGITRIVEHTTNSDKPYLLRSNNEDLSHH